jgi:hypothetical protein
MPSKSDFSDLDALVSPRMDELAELDRELATTVRLGARRARGGCCPNRSGR